MTRPGHNTDRPEAVSIEIDLGVVRVLVNARGARRLLARHPWVYKSDLLEAPPEPGLYPVYHRRRFLALAEVNPRSEIAVRAYAWREGDPWKALEENLDRALAEREEERKRHPDGARRLVHAEGDFLPGLVVDEYAGYLVLAVNTAALEARTEALLARLVERLGPRGVLLKNDGRGRAAEGLSRFVREAHGRVPEPIWFREGARWLSAYPKTGQKTGAFLDQRENRLYAAALAARARPRRVLDAFAYHGAFALQVAPFARQVVLLERSEKALAAAREAFRRNRLPEPELRLANAFDALKALAAGGARFDLVILDPPSFARRKADLERAYRAYKEINLRAIKLLAEGGVLLTASCSFHLETHVFFAMLREAAGDAGRSFKLLAARGQAADHPVLLNVPETGYLKFAALKAVG